MKLKDERKGVKFDSLSLYVYYRKRDGTGALFPITLPFPCFQLN